MEPVTHLLTGAVLARTGFNRKAAYATVAMVLAAELPDSDAIWAFRGPLIAFEHHRGITHTFIALPFEAALVTFGAWAFYQMRRHPRTKVPVNWAWLFAGTLLALLSHLLLDWTNNYGLRPFFPFNPRWYAGSFVFIFEPVLFAILLLALIGPWLFGLIDTEVGGRKPLFRGRPSALVALVAIAALYLLRYDQRDKAIVIARQNGPADSTRVFASPYPGNPFQWHTIADTPTLYQLSTIDTWSGTVQPSEPSDTLIKPPETLPLLAAKRTDLGRIYLDWSMFPVLNELPVPPSPDADPTHPLTQITFADARFMYNTFLLRNAQAHPPLSGSVTLDMQSPEGQRVVTTQMDGHQQN